MGTTSATYTWSGDGVRLSAATGAGTATTDFLVDRNLALPSVAIERDGTGAIVRRSLYGLGRIGIESAAGVPTYEHTDALGSVTDLTAASGASLAWTEYSPYGAVQSAGAAAGVPADPFGFTGQYLDTSTALYHMRARQYDPTIGRFTAVDPVRPAISRPCTSTYSYARNNPVRFVDPSGRESRAAGDYNVGECAVGAFGGTVLAEAGTLPLAGGALLMGFSITLFGVTFGGATPVTLAGLMAGAGLEVLGFTAEMSALALVYTACFAQ